MSDEKQDWGQLFAVVRVKPDGDEVLQFLEDLPLIGPADARPALETLARAGQRSRGHAVRLVRYTAREVLLDIPGGMPEGAPPSGQDNFVKAIYDLTDAQGVTPALVFAPKSKDGGH